MDTILGKKLTMSQRFDEKGRRIPVTIIEAGPCWVLMVKTEEKNGKRAVQLGFGTRKKANKPTLGHIKGAKLEKAPLYVSEVSLKEGEEVKAGDVIRVDSILEKGDKVLVVGISKGKGFAGGVKKWGFAGGPKTHGQSDRWRAPGAIGSGTTPGRVLKGKHMAGRMGNARVTVEGLKVVDIEPEKNLVVVSGPIPGATGSLVIVKKEG